MPLKEVGLAHIGELQLDPRLPSHTPLNEWESDSSGLDVDFQGIVSPHSRNLHLGS